MAVGGFLSVYIFIHPFKIYSSALTRYPEDIRANKHKHDLS